MNKTILTTVLFTSVGIILTISLLQGCSADYCESNAFDINLSVTDCDSDADSYAKLVSEWQGKEIVFPEVMTDFITGDTIDLSDADFTIHSH